MLWCIMPCPCLYFSRNYVFHVVLVSYQILLAISVLHKSLLKLYNLAMFMYIFGNLEILIQSCRACLMICCLVQNDLDRMQLPDTIRWHIQAAMPILIPSMRCSLSCQPPSISNSALVCLQPSITNPGSNSSSSTIPQRNPVLSRVASNASGKSKQQDNDLEIDPWTLLEDGTGSYSSAGNTASIGSGDHANIRATSWLKGAVRVRRTDLTYVGAVDDDG